MIDVQAAANKNHERFLAKMSPKEAIELFQEENPTATKTDCVEMLLLTARIGMKHIQEENRGTKTNDDAESATG